MLTIVAILLVIGLFMDMTPALLIFTPIFLPIAKSLGVDPVHFGIIMTFALCLGICTPLWDRHSLLVARLVKCVLPKYCRT